MMDFVRIVHAAMILHMDIKPDNWLLTTRYGAGRHACAGVTPRDNGYSISLIDFGRAIDLSVFPEGASRVVFRGSCCASNFTSPAMMEVGPTQPNPTQPKASGGSVATVFPCVLLAEDEDPWSR